MFSIVLREAAAPLFSEEVNRLLGSEQCAVLFTSAVWSILVLLIVYLFSGLPKSSTPHFLASSSKWQLQPTCFSQLQTR